MTDATPRQISGNWKLEIDTKMVGNAKLEFLMAKKEEAKRRNEELKETLKRLKVTYTTI